MPDDRLFHKRLGHSAKVSQLTDFEDIIWRDYILSADDFGVMRFSAITLQADHDRLATRPQRLIQRALERVRDVGLIVTYGHQGRTYCAQRDWQNHQRVKHPRATINPKPPDDLLATFSPATQKLFLDWPGKSKAKLEEDFGNISETFGHLARARACEMAMAKANGQRLPAQEHVAVRPSQFSDDINARAGLFCSETYPALYAKHRKGARYLGKPALDYQEALQLCATWDDERLTKLATVFLTTDHEFAEKGSRTMAQFRSLASWCDGKLREAGL